MACAIERAGRTRLAGGYVHLGSHPRAWTRALEGNVALRRSPLRLSVGDLSKRVRGKNGGRPLPAFRVSRNRLIAPDARIGWRRRGLIQQRDVRPKRSKSV